jgi:hypothetical protein
MTGPELTTALWLPHYRRAYRGGTMAGGCSLVEIEVWWLWTTRDESQWRRHRGPRRGGPASFGDGQKLHASPWPTWHHPEAAVLLALAYAATEELAAGAAMHDYLEERGWHPQPERGQGWYATPFRVVRSLGGP